MEPVCDSLISALMSERLRQILCWFEDKTNAQGPTWERWSRAHRQPLQVRASQETQFVLCIPLNLDLTFKNYFSVVASSRDARLQWGIIKDTFMNMVSYVGS